VPAIHAAIMSLARRENASRATAGSTPASAAACRKGLVGPAVEHRGAGDLGRERQPQFVERAIVAGHHLGP
jgi:hypothetical protein